MIDTAIQNSISDEKSQVIELKIHALEEKFEQVSQPKEIAVDVDKLQKELIQHPTFLPELLSTLIKETSFNTMKEFASLGLLRELKLDEKQASLYLGLAKKILQNYRQEHTGIAYYKHKTRFSFDSPLSLEQHEVKKKKYAFAIAWGTWMIILMRFESKFSSSKRYIRDLSSPLKGVNLTKPFCIF